jgi:hypothetical protein
MKNKIAITGLIIGVILIFAQGSFKNIEDYSAPESVNKIILDVGNIPLTAGSVKKFFFLVEEGQNCSIQFLATSPISLFAMTFDGGINQEDDFLANLTIWKTEDTTNASDIFQAKKTGILALFIRNDAYEDSLIKNLRFSLIQEENITKILIRQNDIPLLVGALMTLGSITMLLLLNKNIIGES